MLQEVIWDMLLSEIKEVDGYKFIKYSVIVSNTEEWYYGLYLLWIITVKFLV